MSSLASSSSSSAISTAKHVLRQRMRQILKDISPEDKQRQSRLITEKVLKNEHLITSDRVSIYLSTQNEVSTIDLIHQLMTQGKKIFIPKYDRRDMKMVALESLEEYESLPVTSWNIKQHPLDLHQLDAFDSGGLDLIITPGLAFTESGRRLGSGRGYYDRYFQKIRRLEQQQQQQQQLQYESEEQRHRQHHHHPSAHHNLSYSDSDNEGESKQSGKTLGSQDTFIYTNYDDQSFGNQSSSSSVLKLNCRRRRTQVIGLAFRQQVIPFIPTNEQDVAVDEIVHAATLDDDEGSEDNDEK